MEFAVDDEVLRAALAFVDGFTEPETAQRLTSTARLKQELAALRAETVALQRQLRAQREPPGSRSAEAWRAVAVCQQARRRRAEVENTRLRARVQEYLRLARRFATVMARGCREQNVRVDLPEIVARPLQPPARSSLVQTARGMCLQSAAIFALPYFLSTTTTGASTVRRTVTPMGPTVELFDSRVMPFDCKRTSGAIWDHLTHHKIPHVVQQKVVGNETDYQLEREIKARVALPTSGRSVVIDGVVAAHRIEMPTSFLVAWTVEFKAQIDEAPGAPAYFSATEKVWMLAQPLRTNKDCTLVQTYLVSFSSMPERGDRDKLLAEEHLGSVERHMDKMWGHLESMLLDQARAATPHSKKSSTA